MLLTEVSLELLGNQLYDIFGQKRDTLRELYLPGIVRRPGYGSSDNQELLVQLQRPNEPIGGDSSSARPSTSGSASATSSSGVDAAASSKVAKQHNKSVEKSLKTTVAAEAKRRKALRSSEPIQIVDKKRRSEKPNDVQTEESRLKMIEEEIKNSVAKGETSHMHAFPTHIFDTHFCCCLPAPELRKKHTVSERLKIEHFLKQKSRMDTEYMDEYEIVQEFHAAEKAQLMTDSAALIQMVNFIKFDPKNAHKIAEISTNILNVKDNL